MVNSKSAFQAEIDIGVDYTDKNDSLIIESYFDSETMSVHLKENNYVYAKKGRPGSVRLEKISNEPISKQSILQISEEILNQIDKNEECVMDTEREHSKVLQLGKIRIVITKPPLSDSYEITAVKQIRKLTIKDYKLSEKLESRLTKGAEGILISGAPGEGKSTFIQALAESFNSENMIIKTIEAPRDLDLPKNVTRYSLNQTKPKEIYDILLLSRPDYTLFDEMRTTDDFKLFSDLRLSGVGMVGVVHATNPVDAIQRFIGRIELGIIPHVIDTVIFIKNGKIDKVFEIKMIIKVPEGMKEADLARPIVTVKDFESEKTEFEIYSYGNDTVVVPINDKKEVIEKSESWIKNAALKKVEEYFKTKDETIKIGSIDDNKITIFVNKKDVSRIIGKERQNIKKDEEIFNTRIEIISVENKEIKKEYTKTVTKIGFEVEFSEKYIHLKLGTELIEKTIDVYVEKDYLMTAKVGKKGEIKVRMDTDIGKLVMIGIKKGKILLNEILN